MKILILFSIFVIFDFSQAQSTSGAVFLFGKKFEKKVQPRYGYTNEYYFDQKLDHFNKSNTKTWKQRYWVDVEYFWPLNGSVFLYVGGESEATGYEVNGHLFDRLSKANAAMRIVLEHRFYGKSRPTPDVSNENLKYLSSKQAIEDLANFRNFITKQYQLTAANKWVTFGGSYPGTLSATFRAKYPNLIHASFASSAPMIFVTDFNKYMEVLGKSLDAYNPVCTAEISKAYQRISTLMNTTEGRDDLRLHFRLCESLENPNNRLMFLQTLFNIISNKLQYNSDKDVICSKMLDSTLGDSMERYAAVFTSDNNYCQYNSYQGYIDYFKQSSWDSTPVQNAARQWFYQVCNEFSSFMTTTSTNQPFGNLLNTDYFKKQCADVFGPTFTPVQIDLNLWNTNVYLGNYKFNGTRVFFTNGELDPWSPLGFYFARAGTSVESTVIKGASHCADMLYPNTNDIKVVQDKVFNTISNVWLKQNP